MASANQSSINDKNGIKLAAFANQQKAAIKSGYQLDQDNSDEQVVNARKAAHLAQAKAKAKKKAKMAKASRKKNK